MSFHSSIEADDVNGDNENGSAIDEDALQLVIHPSATKGDDLAGDDAFGITKIIGNVDLK